MPLSTHPTNAFRSWPSSNHPISINFRGRSSSSQATSSQTTGQTEEQADLSSEAPHQAPVNDSRRLGPNRHSLALARIVPDGPPANAPDNDENADRGTPLGHPQPSRLVVVLQPDQSGPIEGATLITMPPEPVAEPISNYDENPPEVSRLSNRTLWLLRVGGIIAGTTFLFPGVVVLSAADQLEQEGYPQNLARGRVLGGVMTGIGAGVNAVAIVSILKACIPNIFSRVTAMAGSRWMPSGPAADAQTEDSQRQAIQLPAANLSTLA